MPADVFISYSSNDQDRVVKLADKLRTAGVSIWVDESGIGAATLWSKEIAGAIKGCKVLVLMVTPNSVKSKNVVKEVSLASEQNKQILPVILEPTQIPEALEYHLAGIQHLDVDGMSASESSEEILPALQRLVGMESEEANAVGHGNRTSRRRSSNIWSDWRLYACVMAAAALGWFLKPLKPVQEAPAAVKRAEILIGGTVPFDAGNGNSLALSRDGKRLVYNLEDRGAGLRVRDLEIGEDEILRGTELEYGIEGSPFFSWDGNEVGLVLDGKLVSLPITGGTPRTLVEEVRVGGDMVFEEELGERTAVSYLQK